MLKFLQRAIGGRATQNPDENWPSIVLLLSEAWLPGAEQALEMARQVTSARGFYSFVSHSFKQVVGLGTAAVVTLSYSVLVATLISVFSYFAATSIEN